MSANAALAPAIVAEKDEERGHRLRLTVAYTLTVILIAGLIIYGFNYYDLDSASRPFSPKHALLRPSGVIGLKLGFLGVGMFLVIFLYPLRKRWPWLSRQGKARHWLDFHVLLGLAAPFIIALHSSFKFRGFAGMAFWIMLAVSISGVVGRYLYGQIPRSLSTAELSLKEAQEVRNHLAEHLERQKILPSAELQSLLRLPTADGVAQMPMLVALAYMMLLDVTRKFRVARLRRHALEFPEKLTTLGGFLPTRHMQLEQAIRTASEEATLGKRILFLSRSQQVFHLWHVVHKPFSYSFAVLALIHIGVVMMMGFF
jgi:hypothetical protein